MSERGSIVGVGVFRSPGANSTTRRHADPTRSPARSCPSVRPRAVRPMKGVTTVRWSVGGDDSPQRVTSNAEREQTARGLAMVRRRVAGALPSRSPRRWGAFASLVRPMVAYQGDYDWVRGQGIPREAEQRPLRLASSRQAYQPWSVRTDAWRLPLREID
jgi:hypothetical protein